MSKSTITFAGILCLLLPGLLHAAPKFFLELQSVTVNDAKTNGKPWDGNALTAKVAKKIGKKAAKLQGKAQPDLYVEVSVNGTQVMKSGKKADTLSATWNSSSQSFNLGDKASEVVVVVKDKDLMKDDLIGTVKFKVTAADAAAEKVFKLSEGLVKSLALKVYQTPKAAPKALAAPKAPAAVAPKALAAPKAPAAVAAPKAVEAPKTPAAPAK